jgi:hypothetical protein
VPGRAPAFTASEPLAIAFAHKHEPVPALPPDVPQPVSDLVYHMLAKTPQERPGNVRVVADRADMLRDALALGEPPSPDIPVQPGLTCRPRSPARCPPRQLPGRPAAWGAIGASRDHAAPVGANCWWPARPRPCAPPRPRPGCT